MPRAALARAPGAHVVPAASLGHALLKLVGL
jgi:hypothetical protein